MLKRFSVEGFKNFENKITIDFSDIRDYKFHPECVADGLLSAAVIYGKNAVGKSNFGLALFDVVSHLTMNNVSPGLYDYYLNANNEYAEFEYVFQFGADEIIYKYKKSEAGDLLNEYLQLNGKELLSDYHRFSMAKNVKKEGLAGLAPNLNWDLKTDKSYIKFFLYNSSLDINHPLSKMMKFVNNMILFKGHNENEFIGFRKKTYDYYDFIFNCIDEFNIFLKKAEIDNTVCAIKDADNITRLYFDGERPMPFFKVASSGTKALYTFYYWYKTAPDVSFMYIDEFDAFYHYELSETIVSMLEKTSGFQKIMTSHNTNLLSNRIMRPDCYFILTKDKMTSFANATERELREGHNLEKLYMSGEFDG